MFHKNYFLFFAMLFFISCNASKSKVKNNASYNNPIIQKNNEAQLQNGMDFIANGNISTTWELKINFEDSIYFKAADGNKFTIANNKSKFEKTADEIGISSVLKNNNIEIHIYKTYCSKAEKTQQITINYLNKTYTGCGSYLQNPLLSNKWKLYKFRNEFVDHLKFVPTLILDLDKNKMEWKDGCNNTKSKIKVEGEKIFFTEIKQTTLSCINTEVTNVLMNNIKAGVATYYFKNDMLYLYLIDDSMLIFKKSI